MTELNEKFDIVLYYTRNTIVAPVEPSYQSVVDANPGCKIDDVLDIYSNILSQYKKDIEKYNDEKHLNKVIESYVFIPEDEKFIENVHAFEKNNFFIGWTESSMITIKDIIKDLIDVS